MNLIQKKLPLYFMLCYVAVVFFTQIYALYTSLYPKLTINVPLLNHLDNSLTWSKINAASLTDYLFVTFNNENHLSGLFNIAFSFFCGIFLYNIDEDNIFTLKKYNIFKFIAAFYLIKDLSTYYGQIFTKNWILRPYGSVNSIFFENPTVNSFQFLFEIFGLMLVLNIYKNLTLKQSNFIQKFD